MKLKTILEQEGYVQNIEELSVKNDKFRKVLYTADGIQLVLMSLQPRESIGLEKHPSDQFFRVEEGYGEVSINGKIKQIEPGSGIIIPAGCEHNITNTSNQQLHLYTLYSPPQHKDKTVQSTKGDAESSDEHYDGHTTE